MLDTLAPDETRRTRVLTLAERLITERDFGSQRPIDDIRQSLDELLLKYDEKTYVSADYRESMDQAAVRAADLARRGLPPEMDEWLETLGHESVRRLSGQLLMDLLANETSAERAGDIARDMGAFVEDLLLAGAYGEGVPVVQALAAAAGAPQAVAGPACAAARDALGQSTAFGEAAEILAEQSAAELADFERLARAIGPAAVPGADEGLPGGGRAHRGRPRLGDPRLVRAARHPAASPPVSTTPAGSCSARWPACWGRSAPPRRCRRCRRCCAAATPA